MWPSSSATCSTGTTPPSPCGTTAPVETRTASPSLGGSVAGAPARDSPTIARRRPAAPGVTMKPSIALLSKPGTSPAATTSSARTRWSARSTGTSSVPSGETASSTIARASSIESTRPT
jgi:hypothetical protein